ncbi:MAG: hypothetical protein QM820_31450 [Minicystis sp.]
MLDERDPRSGWHPAASAPSAASAITSKIEAPTEHRQDGEPRDGALLLVIIAVDEILGVLLVGDVLHVEVHLGLHPAEIEALRRAQVELHERGNPDLVGIGLVEIRLVDVAPRVVEGAQHRGAREPGGIAEARAELEAEPRLVRGDHGEHVRLIVVEEPPRSVGVIAPLAADQAVARPAEEPFGERLPYQDLPAEGASLALVHERLRQQGRRRVAARGEPDRAREEADRLDHQRVGDVERGAPEDVVRGGDTEARVAEIRRQNPRRAAPGGRCPTQP